MTLEELITLYGVEFLGRFYSAHRAFVIDNRDPNNAGRLFVIIPDIQQGIQAWAYPEGLPGGPNSGFKYLTPKPGDCVYVRFERGDPFKPTWSYHGWAVDQMPEELRDNNTCGMVTPAGNKILLSESSDGTGKLAIQINQEVDISIPGGTTINIKGSKMTVNRGNNRGLVNVAQIESLVNAIQKDLIIAKSGKNVSAWQASEMPKLEDKNITH